MAGLQCELCEAEPAILTQMRLADYVQLAIGANCLLPFYSSMITELSGGQLSVTETAATSPAADGANGTSPDTGLVPEPARPGPDSTQDATTGPAKADTGPGSTTGPPRPRGPRGTRSKT